MRQPIQFPTHSAEKSWIQKSIDYLAGKKSTTDEPVDIREQIDLLADLAGKPITIVQSVPMLLDHKTPVLVLQYEMQDGLPQLCISNDTQFNYGLKRWKLPSSGMILKDNDGYTFGQPAVKGKHR